MTDVIVLGGGVSRLPHLYESVPQVWGYWVFSGGHADIVRTKPAPALHGKSSGVRGATWLWQQGRAACRSLDQFVGALQQ